MINLKDSKTKKILFLISLSIWFVLVVISNSTYNKLDKEDFSALIKNDYSVEKIEDINNKSLEISINGDLTTNNLKELAVVLCKKNKELNLNKKEIIINVFGSNYPVVEDDDFYVDGLLYKMVLDTEKSTVDISEYQTISDVNPSKRIVNFSNKDIKANNGNIIISIDMDLKENENDYFKVLEQGKAFISLFREANSDKEINSVELIINPNSDNTKFKLHTDFENTLEVINTIKL